MTKDILFDRLLDKKSHSSASTSSVRIIPINSCPACGGRVNNIRYSRTIDYENPIFVYICGRCGNEFAYDTRSKKFCVVTAIDGGDDGIKEIFGRTIPDKDNDAYVIAPNCQICGASISPIKRRVRVQDYVYSCPDCTSVFMINIDTNKVQIIAICKNAEQYKKSSDYSDIMNDNGLKTKDELLEFLANRYREGKTTQNAEKNTPGFMTIDDAKHHIQFGARNDCTSLEKLLYTVTITYQPDVYDTTPDTVELECSSFEELKRFWEEYIKINNIYPDCISGFDIDLSKDDQNYINRLKEAMGRLLREIKTDLLCKHMPTTEDALDALLSSEPFKDIAEDIIFPRTELVQRGPNPEDVVKTVKRYYR